MDVFTRFIPWLTSGRSNKSVTPRKSNFSLPYTNQSLSVHSLPRAQTLADSSLEQLPPHLRWSQLACTESRPTLLFSS